MSYASERDKHLHESAVKAVVDIPEDSKPALAAAHGTLYSWLIGMDEAHHEPAKLITAAMAEPALAVFEKEMQLEFDAQDVYAAWQFLSADLRNRLVASAIKGFVTASACGAQLMTKSSDNAFWDVTGFFSDGKPAVVCAKVGSRPYQPIGFDDGVHYVATEASKTLWVRDFAFALMLPYAPPFKVSREEVSRQAPTGMLSEAELKGMNTAIGWLEDELNEFAKFTDPEGVKEASSRLRDTISLARLNVPRLDYRMTKLAEEHEELGANLEGADPKQLATAALEFMRMLLADNKIAKQVTETVIVADGDKANQLQEQVKARLRAVLTDDGVKDSEEAVAALSLAKQALPEVASFVDTADGEMPLHEAIKAVLEKLA